MRQSPASKFGTSSGTTVPCCRRQREGGIRAHWPGAGSTKEKTRSGNDGGEDDDAAQPSHKRRRVTATI
ncbi:hypothetical protein GQ600_8280 [Phytophthora cactorum]|nr:hypothetical protein GQ600_8280 [Phytophthora cactorum]